MEESKEKKAIIIKGLVLYIQLSSLRRVAKALSEIHKVPKTVIWKWPRTNFTILVFTILVLLITSLLWFPITVEAKGQRRKSADSIWWLSFR